MDPVGIILVSYYHQAMHVRNWLSYCYPYIFLVEIY
jgi:hypothetical protein